MHESAPQKREGSLGLNESPGLLLGALFRISGINCGYNFLYALLAKPQKKVEKLIGKDALSGDKVLGWHSFSRSESSIPAMQV
jgi:hypothetical protein